MIEQSQIERTHGSPKNNDVLCGRGGLSNKHPGNRLFRRLVNSNKQLYKNTSNPVHKQMLATSIIQAIQKRGGRFVRKDGKQWVPISPRESFVKTSQALRENPDSASPDQSSSTSAPSASSSPQQDGQSNTCPSLEPIPISTGTTALENFSGLGTALLSLVKDDDHDELRSSQHSTAEVSIEGDDLEPISLDEHAIDKNWETLQDYLVLKTSKPDSQSAPDPFDPIPL